MVYLILGYLVIATLLALSIGRKLREDNTDNEDPPISPSKGTNIKPNRKRGGEFLFLIEILTRIEVIIFCAWMLTNLEGVSSRIDLGNRMQVFTLILMGGCMVEMFLLNNRFVKRCDKYPQTE